jgi:predicted O-methyltransferase YrrM
VSDITLRNVSVPTLLRLGDAALRGGDVAVARGLYRNAVNASPSSQSAQARLGLTLRPTRRAREMLDILEHAEKVAGVAWVGSGIATWQKNPAFLHDPRFMELAERHQEIATPDLANWHWNLQTVLWAAQLARTVPGDFVELGVFHGHTTLFLADYLAFGGWDKRWRLYDTFEGIPDDQVDPGWEKINKSAYGGTFTYEEVRDRFAPFPNIEVIRGRVPEVFEERGPEAISFMHIDLNNATAEVAALDALYDRISPGGVVVFDDYGWMTAVAQQTAETAWFKARDLPLFPLPTGQAVFVKPGA